MNKQEKLQALSNKVIEKFGEKSYQRLSIISEERFGGKTNLKIKFLESVLSGHITPDEMWTSDEVILILKEKIDSASDDTKREKILLEILDTYNPKDPKIKLLLRRYSNILSKHIKPEKITIAI